MRKRSVLLSLGALFARPSLALYDPKPNALLAPAIGCWRGTLVYVDYQDPGKAVTLQTRLVATLVTPDELGLYYVFDDGPGKTVYSYERMVVDAAKAELSWTSGVTKPSVSRCRITAATATQDGLRLDFDRTVDSGTDKYSFEVGARSWLLTKLEVRTGKQDLQRSRYEYARD